MLRLTGDQRPQFRALFLGLNTHHLFSTAMEGNLPKTGLRGIAWGFFLGTLPAGMNVAGWAQCAQQKRKEYDALVSEHCVDPWRSCRLSRRGVCLIAHRDYQGGNALPPAGLTF